MARWWQEGLPGVVPRQQPGVDVGLLHVLHGALPPQAGPGGVRPGGVQGRAVAVQFSNTVQCSAVQCSAVQCSANDLLEEGDMRPLFLLPASGV